MRVIATRVTRVLRSIDALSTEGKGQKHKEKRKKGKKKEKEKQDKKKKKRRKMMTMMMIKKGQEKARAKDLPAAGRE